MGDCSAATSCLSNGICHRRCQACSSSCSNVSDTTRRLSLTAHTHNVHRYCHFHFRRPWVVFFFFPFLAATLAQSHTPTQACRLFFFLIVFFFIVKNRHNPGVCFHSRLYFYALLNRSDHLRSWRTTAASESRIQYFNEFLHGVSMHGRTNGNAHTDSICVFLSHLLRNKGVCLIFLTWLHLCRPHERDLDFPRRVISTIQILISISNLWYFRIERRELSGRCFVKPLTKTTNKTLLQIASKRQLLRRTQCTFSETDLS